MPKVSTCLDYNHSADYQAYNYYRENRDYLEDSYWKLENSYTDLVSNYQGYSWNYYQDCS